MIAAAPVAIIISPAQKSLLRRESKLMTFHSSWPGSSRPSRLGGHCFASSIEIAGTSPAMTTERVSRELLRFDAALFDDALPFVHFLDHERAEVGRRHLHDLGAFAGELLLHLGRVLRIVERLRHLVDDRLRRAGR